MGSGCFNEDMRNLRHRYTYAERIEFQLTINDMRRYLLPLLLARQENTCASCKTPATHYDIDHKVYNPALTINELQALCIPCHKLKTDFRPLRNRNVVEAGASVVVSVREGAHGAGSGCL